MAQYDKEVEANFRAFDVKWPESAADVRRSLERSINRYLDSYQLVTSLQAWRALLLENVMTAECVAFFLEAQNDALHGHVMSRMGVWRSALQALRSCMENSLTSLFYMDHAVELRLWDAGKHRLAFSELGSYFTSHPDMQDVPAAINGLSVLRSEYGTLSRAVHASAASFRMAENGKPELWSDDKARLGAWLTRQRLTISSINLVLLCLFRTHLQGTRLPALREAISRVVPKGKHAIVKRHLKISLS
jgi:hypothetical protein